MKIVAVFIITTTLLVGARGDLPPPERSYNILMLLPVASKSHRNVFLSLAVALADRGHKVVMLSNFEQSSKHENITEINHGIQHMTGSNLFEERKTFIGTIAIFKTILPLMARQLYKAESVRKLYDKRKQFDLTITNGLFNEVSYPFLHEATFILLSTSGLDPRHSAISGNILNPSYVPFFELQSQFSTCLWGRLRNTAAHIFMQFYWRHWAVIPLVQKEISAQFPDLPPLLEIERNQSLSLMNTHFSITTTVPLLPSQVEIGAMHCRPGKPLTKDIESWITDAGSAGVIYFSLGTVALGKSMPNNYKQVFIDAFRRIPQRVLWKYEKDLMKKSDNVKISKWLPQQDILAHKNVKVFISHGGLLGLQESIYHATPLLVLPIFADQPKNGMFVESSGLGKVLSWEGLTADSIVDALNDIVNNSHVEMWCPKEWCVKSSVSSKTSWAAYWEATSDSSG